jgi:hypothetical protein
MLIPRSMLFFSTNIIHQLCWYQGPCFFFPYIYDISAILILRSHVVLLQMWFISYVDTSSNSFLSTNMIHQLCWYAGLCCSFLQIRYINYVDTQVQVVHYYKYDTSAMLIPRSKLFFYTNMYISCIDTQVHVVLFYKYNTPEMLILRAMLFFLQIWYISYVDTYNVGPCYSFLHIWYISYVGTQVHVVLFFK